MPYRLVHIGNLLFDMVWVLSAIGHRLAGKGIAFALILHSLGRQCSNLRRILGKQCGTAQRRDAEAISEKLYFVELIPIGTVAHGVSSARR